MERILKRLHVTLPAYLFDKIVINGDLDRVDDLIANLISKHYGKDEDNGDEINGNRKEKKNQFRY